MNDMRAARFHQFGGPEVLQIDRIPVPEPAAGEVLVQVGAVSVNGSELLDRAGRFRLLTGRTTPRQTGLDLVGTVVGHGMGEPTLAAGQQVWGTVREKGGFSSAAEYVVVPEDHLSAAPKSISELEAATLLAGGTTGLRALRDEARIRRGERLLVRGAAGGVGSVVVQLGRVLGAHVTGLARPSSADYVRGLGADEVIDYATPPSDLRLFDVIVDASSAGRHLAYRKRLAPGGRFIALSVDFDHIARELGAIAWSAVHGRQRVRFFRGAPRTELLAEVASLADREAVRPVVDTVYPLASIREAHRRLESGGVQGKLVISIA
ncbi:NAD(P)-dependent alcohol dehydrogenase [Isoptericola halotolerans]